MKLSRLSSLKFRLIGIDCMMSVKETLYMNESRKKRVKLLSVERTKILNEIKNIENEN